MRTHSIMCQFGNFKAHYLLSMMAANLLQSLATPPPNTKQTSHPYSNVIKHLANTNNDTI